VVGGRQFTSATMQRNCHEFIAYENLVGSSGVPRAGRQPDRGGRPAAGTSSVTAALPLVLRALKVLSEREVTPQLGLLKSTLLQLDSTFSERNYGPGSFRDFMEKVAQTGAVTLKHAGRSMLVEVVEGSAAAAAAAANTVAPAPPADVVEPAVGLDVTPAADAEAGEDEDAAMPSSPKSMQDGIRAVQHAFAHAHNVRWPMYVRQARQFLRSAIEGFDERKYGFTSVADLLRAAGKENILRIERDRQGAVRVFPGLNLLSRPRAVDLEGLPADVEADEIEGEAQPGNVATAEPVTEVVAELPIVEAQVEAIPELDEDRQPFAPEPEAASEQEEPEGPQPGNELAPKAPGGRRRRTTAAAEPGARAPRRTRAAKPREPRARKTSRSRSSE
jgi:hypothetical protein